MLYSQGGTFEMAPVATTSLLKETELNRKKGWRLSTASILDAFKTCLETIWDSETLRRAVCKPIGEGDDLSTIYRTHKMMKREWNLRG
jgi:hypothetical protein